MSAVATLRPFVTGLRTPRGQVVRVGGESGERVIVRVQLEPLWDAIAVDCSTTTPVSELVSTLLKHFGVHDPASDFMVKLRGWEVKGADATVSGSGARPGSTFLVQYRYKRPIR